MDALNEANLGKVAFSYAPGDTGNCAQRPNQEQSNLNGANQGSL